MKKPFPSALALSTVLLLSCASRQSKQPDCIDSAKINPEGICTMQYDPVCGCDNITYSNACVADNAGVTAYSPGPCSSSN